MPSGQVDAALTNGHDGHVHPAAASGKKGKTKKALDSSEASRLLQARISQLEQDAAGEKDQELEIGTFGRICDFRFSYDSRHGKTRPPRAEHKNIANHSSFAREQSEKSRGPTEI
jgi:hypothetical protein